MSNCFIILAAGKSNRFISKIPKPYIRYKGDILINHSINKAILSKKFSKIVVAINKGHKKYIKKLNKNNVHFIEGGKSRADSSRRSLKYLSMFAGHCTSLNPPPSLSLFNIRTRGTATAGVRSPTTALAAPQTW